MPNILIRLDPYDGDSLQVPSFDGSGHNKFSPAMGSAGSSLINIAPIHYDADGAALSGNGRPSPRTISNEISQQDGESLSALGLTNMVWAMGQFLDHDLSLTPAFSREDAVNAGETLDIPISSDDPYMNPGGVEGLTIPFQRSAYVDGTGTDSDNPRQFPNEITAWIDGSNIYGSSDERAALLRSYVGGRLKVSRGNFLPLDPGGHNDNPGPSTELFVAGDVRANENVVLSSMHTLFVREHNRFARVLARQHSDWTDEQIFQRARQLNVAQLQHIVFKEFLPIILGQPLESYGGYDPTIEAGISRTFSTAAFRFGHTMVSSEIARLDNTGKVIKAGNLNLAEAFFPNADLLKSTGIDAILRGNVSTLSQNADSKVINELRNLLFSFGGQFAAQDLKALNIQRGRDHGLADYNTIRDSFGLARVTDFSQITPDPLLQGKLRDLYGSVDNIDAIVGLFAETPSGSAAFGETITAVLVDQFTRLRDGDRFYYENVLSEAEIAVIESTKLADIIERNTNSRGLQDNVFTLKQVGNAKDNVIRGGLGQDTVMAGGGNDRVYGYYGQDWLLGEDGNDRLDGDHGSDVLDGGSGNDRLYGHQGDDRLLGEDGNDVLMAGAGNDAINGGKGYDSLIGGGDNDYLSGGLNSDRLMGGAGQDKLVGASYYKRGADERDTLSGGLDSDRFILGNKLGIFYGGSGNMDFARVTDFDVSEDSLVLHGSRAQYSTATSGSLTSLYFNNAGERELVAQFKGDFLLDDATVHYR